MFRAKRGAGSFLNSTKITTNTTDAISKSLLLSGWIEVRNICTVCQRYLGPNNEQDTIANSTTIYNQLLHPETVTCEES